MKESEVNKREDESPELGIVGAVISQTVSVEIAAKLLGIGRQTAYNLVRTGQLPGARRLGRRIIISRKAIDAFLEDEDQKST